MTKYYPSSVTSIYFQTNCGDLMEKRYTSTENKKCVGIYGKISYTKLWGFKIWESTTFTSCSFFFVI